MNLADLLDPASPGALNPFRAKRGPCAFSALLRPLIGCMRAPVRKRAPVRMARQDHKAGSAVARVLACVNRAQAPKLACQIRNQLRIDRATVANALQKLVKRGEIVRMNAVPPYLYKVK